MLANVEQNSSKLRLCDVQQTPSISRKRSRTRAPPACIIFLLFLDQNVLKFNANIFEQARLQFLEIPSYNWASIKKIWIGY